MKRWWRSSEVTHVSVWRMNEPKCQIRYRRWPTLQSFTERPSLVWSPFGRIPKLSCLDSLAWRPNDPAMGNTFGGHAGPGRYRGLATESTPVVRDTIMTEPKRAVGRYIYVKLHYLYRSCTVKSGIAVPALGTRTSVKQKNVGGQTDSNTDHHCS